MNTVPNAWRFLAIRVQSLERVHQNTPLKPHAARAALGTSEPAFPTYIWNSIPFLAFN